MITPLRSFQPGPSAGPPPPPGIPAPAPSRSGEDLDRILGAPADFSAIYRVVRTAVRRTLGLERPGLGLALSDLPPALGAYWQVTGNLIVLNEGLVETMRRHASSPREFNSFVFVILAHEYLHTLGYLEEGAVRPATAQVARAMFGPDHPASKMASGDLWKMYPFLQYAPQGRGGRFRIVRGFDLDTTASYIR